MLTEAQEKKLTAHVEKWIADRKGRLWVKDGEYHRWLLDAHVSPKMLQFFILFLLAQRLSDDLRTDSFQERAEAVARAIFFWGLDIVCGQALASEKIIASFGKHFENYEL